MSNSANVSRNLRSQRWSHQISEANYVSQGRLFLFSFSVQYEKHSQAEINVNKNYNYSLINTVNKKSHLLGHFCEILIRSDLIIVTHPVPALGAGCVGHCGSGSTWTQTLRLPRWKASYQLTGFSLKSFLRGKKGENIKAGSRFITSFLSLLPFNTGKSSCHFKTLHCDNKERCTPWNVD